MAAEVTKSDGEVVKHERGQGVTVKEGHLFVLTMQSNLGEPVAVYAPGNWKSVDVARNPRE